MADTRVGTPPALDQTGSTVIWFVKTIADLTAVKAGTELGAATSSDLTYSFTTDGFPVTSSQEKTTDDRLTLEATLESLAKVTTNFGDGLTYVDSPSVPGSATNILKPVAPATTLSGFFVVRPNVPYATLAAAGQKGTVYPVTLGPQLRGPIDGNGKFRWRQQVVLTAPPVETTFAA